jgi:Bacterial Ig-like domain (group 3)
MNLRRPHGTAGKAARRGAARVLMVGVATVTVAGAAAMAAPGAFASTAKAPVKHATTTKMSALSGYVGSELKLTAKVTGSTPKGWVKFVWDGKTLCSAALSNGTAGCRHAFGGVGSLRVEAVYGGNSSHKASSGVATVKVMAIPTTTRVTASRASATTGQSVTLSAAVAPTAATGTVTFSDAAGELGATKVSGGKASLTISWTKSGTYTVSAVYGGNATHLRSSGTTKVTVTAPPPVVYSTTTAITIDADAASPTLNTEPAGPVTVPFTVTDNTPGGPAPTGTVTISDPADIPDQPVDPAFTGCTDTTPLVPAGVNAQGEAYSTGECTVATPTEAWGFVLMRATYNPSGTAFTTSNTGDTEYKIINLMVTATGVTPDTATAGPVTLTATVLPAGPAAASANTAGGNLLAAFSETGGDTVDFTSGGTAIAGCTDVALLWNATTLENYAQCTTTLAAGTYAIGATFSGDEYAATSAGSETLTVS